MHDPSPRSLGALYELLGSGENPRVAGDQCLVFVCIDPGLSHCLLTCWGLVCLHRSPLYIAMQIILNTSYAHIYAYKAYYKMQL